MSDFNDYKPGELYFLPLGGSGEYGRNLNLYCYNDNWLMLDLGTSFNEADLPGVEQVLPDPRYIEQRRHQLKGLIVTHSHEDHIGGIPALWPRLKCPIYVTEFAAAFLMRKLSEMDGVDTPQIHIIKPMQEFSVGPFRCRFVPVTHSIPEAQMVEIVTPAGRVIHTGDFKIDADPVSGAAIESGHFTQLGDSGVLAVVSDSTNAGVPGRSGSERLVEEGLTKLFARLPNRIAITCFSSHIGRICSIAHAAQQNGRQVALVGRSLWRFCQIARELGYLKGIGEFLNPEEAAMLPRNNIVYICTGSQGETRAALSRIAAGEHRDVSFEKGDHIIYSARQITGNELAIGRLFDRLIINGQELYTKENTEECIYVSGHPCQEELTEMYQWLRPQLVIPVHGERRQQESNADLARRCQAKQVIIPDNGHVIRLAPGMAEHVGNVTPGKLARDGRYMVSDQAEHIRERRKMHVSGSAMVTVVLDDKHRLLGSPKVTLRGISEGEEGIDDVLEVIDAIELALDKVPKSARSNDETLTEVIRLAVRRKINEIHEKKPVTDVHIIRV